MRKSVLITLIVGLLAVGGFGAYFLAKEFTHLENNQNVKLENKLMIGTYAESESTEKIKSLNKIYIEIVNNGDVVEKLNYQTDDKTLIKDRKFENCVFVDLSDLMLEYTNDLGVRFWSLSNPSKNYVSVRTEFLLGGFLSEEIKITDCGLYLVNIPQENDDVPQVEHAYFYQNTKVGW